MNRNRGRPPEPWGIYVVGVVLVIFALAPLPFEFFSSLRVMMLRLVLLAPAWVALAVGVGLKFNLARLAVIAFLTLEIAIRSLLLVFTIERESLYSLGYFLLIVVASLAILHYLKRPDIRAAFTGEDYEPPVVELVPAVWQAEPEPEPGSTAIFRDPSHRDR